MLEVLFAPRARPKNPGTFSLPTRNYIRRANEITAVSLSVVDGRSRKPEFDRREFTHMKKTAIALLLACVIAAPAVFAQESDATAPAPNEGGRGAHMVQHRVSYLTTVLSLNSAQQAQVTTILSSSETNRSAMHTSMKTAHTNLQNAIRSNDAAAMEAAANAIGTLTAQETLAHAKSEAAIYQVLTRRSTDQDGAARHRRPPRRSRFRPASGTLVVCATIVIAVRSDRRGGSQTRPYNFCGHSNPSRLCSTHLREECKKSIRRADLFRPPGISAMRVTPRHSPSCSTFSLQFRRGANQSAHLEFAYGNRSSQLARIFTGVDSRLNGGK